MYIAFHLSYSLFLKLVMKFEVSRKFFETQIQNFMKIRPVEVESFHSEGRRDRQTGMTKLTVAFRKFTKASKKKK